MSVLSIKISNFFLSESERYFAITCSRQQIDSSGARGDTSLCVPPWRTAAIGAELDEQIEMCKD